MSSSKNKNPLFVVTNKGKDVEEVENLFDAFFKKLGFGPVMNFLDQIFNILLMSVQSYAAFTVVKEFFDDLVDSLEKVLKMVDPVLAFSIIKR